MDHNNSITWQSIVESILPLVDLISGRAKVIFIDLRVQDALQNK